MAYGSTSYLYGTTQQRYGGPGSSSGGITVVTVSDSIDEPTESLGRSPFGSATGTPTGLVHLFGQPYNSRISGGA